MNKSVTFSGCDGSPGVPIQPSCYKIIGMTKTLNMYGRYLYYVPLHKATKLSLAIAFVLWLYFIELTSFFCLYLRISLTTELIWFSFTMQRFLGPRKTFNYYWGGYHSPPHQQKKIRLKLFKKIKTQCRIDFTLTHIKCPQMASGAKAIVLL